MEVGPEAGGFDRRNGSEDLNGNEMVEGVEYKYK